MENLNNSEIDMVVGGLPADVSDEFWTEQNVGSSVLTMQAMGAVGVSGMNIGSIEKYYRSMGYKVGTKEILSGDIYEPEWLADPSHRIS
ncbi:hypothetical protein HLH36_17180 [Gluconacetobacter aggeris]|uniref:Uncharacterized protein n=1 Tax=Gluconacetobacter aggeris TaxID=1286186 RepID=A0A7W4P0V1_9PROT|nr:hypothetical protein [Gluconacetobacter aggeris]MBB2170055.1 hypothetical protein [Gluconacetobacter aggeris]